DLPIDDCVPSRVAPDAGFPRRAAMQYAHRVRDYVVSALALLASPLLWAQQQPSAPPAQAVPASSAATQAPAAAAAPKSVSSSLGLYAFPAKNQTAEQQATDEKYCFDWAKTQTGIDPNAIKPQAPDQQAATNAADNATKGARAKGAAGGAAAGAVI